MAVSTYKTELYSNGGSGTTFTKLVSIKDYPDLEGDPEMLETTTLSDDGVTQIPGIKGAVDYVFTFNYTKSDYDTLKADEDTQMDFKLAFGEAGADGIYAFSGKYKVKILGKSVNEVREAQLTIARSSALTTAATI